MTTLARSASRRYRDAAGGARGRAHAARREAEARALRGRGDGRASEADDRQAEARAVRASSERGRQLLDQLELQLEELEATATEDELAAEAAAAARPGEPGQELRAPQAGAGAAAGASAARARGHPGAVACPCCGGKLAKLGEDITETLEVIPRQWKVIQTVREKFSCRSCETITQPPAPFHPIARGRAGAEPAGDGPARQVRQSPAAEPPERDASPARASISTSRPWPTGSAPAPHAGAAGRADPAHVLAAARIHGDDTTVPVLAKMQDRHRPAMDLCPRRPAVRRTRPPAAMFYYSRDRDGEHPRRHLAAYAGILQADAYAGFNDLYEPGRSPGPITEAACWSHGRRKFFELADIAKAAAADAEEAGRLSPLALEAVRRIDAIFDARARRSTGCRRASAWSCAGSTWPRWSAIWRPGCAPSAPRLSRHNDVAKAMDYMLTRWPAFTRFLDDGRICLTNNAAERALRGVALGRRNWTFCGSDRGGERAAAIYTLIATAKLNDVDPEAWLADVLRRINDHPASGLDELLPWNWTARNDLSTEAAVRAA